MLVVLPAPQAFRVRQVYPAVPAFRVQAASSVTLERPVLEVFRALPEFPASREVLGLAALRALRLAGARAAAAHPLLR